MLRDIYSSTGHVANANSATTRSRTPSIVIFARVVRPALSALSNGLAHWRSQVTHQRPQATRLICA
eukprot:11030292-Prorocentrum_lima.AAC.1